MLTKSLLAEAYPHEEVARGIKNFSALFFLTSEEGVENESITTSGLTNYVDIMKPLSKAHITEGVLLGLVNTSWC